MAQNRWKYFVGVYEDNQLSYVTETNGTTAIWKKGEKAKEFSMRTASDICEGLNLNMIYSVVIKAPSYMEIQNDE